MDAIDLQAYRRAIKEKICTFCLCQADDGTCTRPEDRPCVFETHLETVVKTVIRVGEDAEIDDVVAALRTDLCPTCQQCDDGHCARRDAVHCALDAYVLLVVDVIRDVAEQQRARRAVAARTGRNYDRA